MFKLVKIMNSGVNVPEPEAIPTESGLCCSAGSALILDSDLGCLIDGGETAVPTHIIMQNPNEDFPTSYCYRIHPNMVFEAPIYDGYDSIGPGSPLALKSIDLDGQAAVRLANSPEETVATVFYVAPNLKHGDKILLTFNK